MLGHAVVEQGSFGSNILVIPKYFVCCVSSSLHIANATIIFFL